MTGGRKNTSEQRIIEDQKKEMARLKDVIAEIILENLEIKKKIGDRMQRGGRTLDRCSVTSIELS